MRNIKELLQLMLNHKEHFSSGLCSWVNTLQNKGIISLTELEILHFYIQNHRTSKFSSIEAYQNRNSDFYWLRGNIAPRIKWINKHIKLN